MTNIHLLLLLRLTAAAAFSPTRPPVFSRSTASHWNIVGTSSSSSKYHRRPTYQHRQPRQWHATTTSSSSDGADEGSSEAEDSSTMKILGVCGGIGSGKSTACQLMVESLGCVARIDADKMAHVVYEPGSQSLKDIIAEFGKDILDESDDAQIDRKKLGAIVFSDANAMSKLEQIVWPHVKDKIEERIDEIKQEHKSNTTDAAHNIIVVEAALLLETNWHDLLDGLWVVRSSRPVAVQRLKNNRGLSEEEALVRICAQDTRRGLGRSDDALRKEMEEGVVTAVIANDGTMDELEEALRKALCDPASFKR